MRAKPEIQFCGQFLQCQQQRQCQQQQCQHGKGVHFALRRLIAHLSKFYKQNGRSNKGYALLVDFARFFDNIDHAVLFEMLEQQIADRRVVSLIRDFISACGPGNSLGLGSQVSQIAAIFYPNALDHFIKENLRVKYYGRYMDDLYLIHADKEYLKHCLAEIKRVCQPLKIMVNEKKTKIVKLSNGMEFLKGKYILLENGRTLCRPGKDPAKRMRRKLKKFKPLMLGGQMTFNDARQAYQSWRGNYRRRFKAYSQVRRMDRLYNDLFIQQP
jgi:retron-type reverse transcriptase